MSSLQDSSFTSPTRKTLRSRRNTSSMGIGCGPLTDSSMIFVPKLPIYCSFPAPLGAFEKFLFFAVSTYYQSQISKGVNFTRRRYFAIFNRIFIIYLIFFTGIMYIIVLAHLRETKCCHLFAAYIKKQHRLSMNRRDRQ